MNMNCWHLPSSEPKYDMVDMTMARMDEEIARRKSEVSDLSFQRNFLSPVSRLPTEILQAIFMYLAHEYHEKDDLDDSTLPRWINVTYVCRHWRNVTLNYSILWSYLSITSPRWAAEFLARSRQAPLKANVGLGRHSAHWALYFVEQAMGHVDRIQEFRLSLQDYSDVAVTSALSPRAPHLTSLTISANIDQWDWPGVLFSGDTPMLRTLDLEFCPVAWYSLKLNGLTTLALRYIPAEFHQHTADFLATLRCMPNLTVLHLESALSSAADFLSSAASKTLQEINLPSLSRLWITAPLLTVAAFLCYVKVPSKAIVRLTCECELGILEDYAPLPLVLAQRFETSSLTIRSLSINLCDLPETLTFNTSEDNPMPDGEWDPNVPLLLTIDLDESRMTDDADRFIGDVCCSMPLVNVQRLRVKGPSRSSTFWTRTLEHIRGLEYLELHCGRMPDLASILSVPRHPETQGTGSGWAYAPALQGLHLNNISFKHLTPTGSDMSRYVDVQHLYDALSNRIESCGILTMDGCIVTEGHVKAMTGLWGDGRFHIIEEYSRPRHDSDWSDSEESDADDSEDS